MLNGTLDPELAVQVHGLGFRGVRCGPEGVAAARAAGLRPLVVVMSIDEIDTWAEGLDLEFMNEPDGTVDVQMTPQLYAAHAYRFIHKCRQFHARPWVGVVSNTHAAGLEWLRQMLLVLRPDPSVGVTIHRYHPPGARGWWTPHVGASSRANEVTQFREIVGDRPWGISEFGYHTAPQIKVKWLPKWWPGNTWRWTDEQVAENVRQEWTFWAAQGAEFAVLYQINDGPTNTREDRYGIRYLDGAWKPVAGVLRAA